MTYTPAVGDRILVRRTRSIHGGTGTITGQVLNILTIDGVPGIEGRDYCPDHSPHQPPA